MSEGNGETGDDMNDKGMTDIKIGIVVLGVLGLLALLAGFSVGNYIGSTGVKEAKAVEIQSLRDEIAEQKSYISKLRAETICRINCRDGKCSVKRFGP